MIFNSLVRDIKTTLDKPIVMIGLMGVGKTRIGRELAKALSVPYADSDDEIIAASGYTIAEIFDKFGEDHFRDGEKKVIRRLIEPKLKVISTGGGAVMTPETFDVIKNEAFGIWLQSDIDILVERTKGNKRRPLLNNTDVRKTLEGLLEKRAPVYQDVSCITVDTNNLSVKKTTQRVLKAIHQSVCNQTKD